MPSPNTGLYAESIMQLGFVGSLIFPFLVAFILYYAGLQFKKLGYGVTVIVACKVLIQLTNVPVLRTDFVLSFILLSILLAIFLKFYKPTRINEGKNEK